MEYIFCGRINNDQPNITKPIADNKENCQDQNILDSTVVMNAWRLNYDIFQNLLR